jgi:hypothetical protein
VIASENDASCCSSLIMLFKRTESSARLFRSDNAEFSQNGWDIALNSAHCDSSVWPVSVISLPQRYFVVLAFSKPSTDTVGL